MNKKILFHVFFWVIFTSAVLAADEKTPTLILKPVLFYGVILGLYELFLIHSDENFAGSHWFGHGIQAVGFMLIAIFAVMNVGYAMNLVGASAWNVPFWLKTPLAFQLLIALILNIKMHSVSAVIHTSGFAARGLSEHWTHTTLISALVVAVPYVHPFVSQFMPSWFIS